MPSDPLCDLRAVIIAEKPRKNRHGRAHYFHFATNRTKSAPECGSLSEDYVTAGRRMDPPTHKITHLLHAWSEGDQSALHRLMPIVYDDLHRLARRYMAQERPDHTLQATALVHEAYLRLLDSAHPSWQDRAHFLAVCARTMRRVLVNLGRTHQALKRGGDAPSLCLNEAVAMVGRPGTDVVAVDDALTALAALDPRKSQVVELRFFGGLSAKETAEVLKISEATVLREWTIAKGWLRRELIKREAVIKN
jgi:RNA polymerase sigma factor (TIGR02999 family)